MSTSKEVSDFITMMLLMQQKKRDAANDVITNAYRTAQTNQLNQANQTQADLTARAKAAHDNAASGAGGGGAQVGGWWTPERQKYAADYLQKNAGLSQYGAAGLVARWAGVESPSGPNSVNPKSGAVGIAQGLGSRKAGYQGSFDAQLAYAAKELNTTEKDAGDKLRSAANGQDGAIGASMFERAEGYDPNTGADNFTVKTPVAHVYSNITGAPTPTPAPAPAPAPAPQAQTNTPSGAIPGTPYVEATPDNITPAEKSAFEAYKQRNPEDTSVEIGPYTANRRHDASLKAPAQDQQAPDQQAQAQPPVQAVSGAPRVDANTPNPYGLAPQALQAQVDYDWQRTQAQAPQAQTPQAQAPQAQAPQAAQPDTPTGSEDDANGAARGGLIQHFAKGGSVKSFADGGSADDDDEEEELDAPTAPAAPAQSSPVAPTLPAPTAPAPAQGIADPSQPPAQSFQANATPQAAPVTSGGNDAPDNNPLSGLFSAVSKGIRSLEGEHGLTSDALPGSAQAAQGRQNFLSGAGAASPEQLAAAKKIVDPTGQLNENLANCAALEATSNFWLEHGEPEKAAKASGAMMLLLRNTSAKYGDLATQELNAGHTLAGLHAITKAYDQVPDGHSVSATENPDGSAEVVHRDPNGKVLWQGRATPAQLLGVALGLKNGTEYWKQLIQNAGSKDPDYEAPDTQAEKDAEEGSDAQTRLGIPEPGQAARYIGTTMTPEAYAEKSIAYRKGADEAYAKQKSIAADRAAPAIAEAKRLAAVKGETQKQALENEKAADAQFDTALATYAPPGGKPPELTGADKADVVSAAQHIMTTPGVGATEANRMALDVRFDKSTLQPDPNPKNPGGGIFTRPGEPPVALKAPAVMALKRIRATRTARDAEAAIAAKARQGNIDRVTSGASDMVGALGRGIQEQVHKPLTYEPKGFEIPVIQ